VTAIVVRPIRFTDNLDEMRTFLEAVGLRPRVESVRGGWVDMVGGAGMVALHSAATATSGATHGETRLGFEAEDVRTLAKRLIDAGVADVSVYDEAYGQALRCTDPLGDVIVVDDRPDDLYGYRLHQAHPDERLSVTPVRFTDPDGDYGRFLEALGLPSVGGDEYFATFRGSGDTGEVGLHYVVDGELPIVPGPAAVHLTFTTREALADMAERLRAAGYRDASVVTDEFAPFVRVTDPDGRQCQIHAAD
jgi:hypothetical protein